MNKIKLLPSLLIFAEIAHRGSFTAAGQHLNMSKSAVSQQITRLEAIVGTQLLTRNTRGLSVTAAGKVLLERCELLQDQVELAFNALSNIESAPKGTFSVTFPHSLECDVAIPAIRQLCEEFPGLEPVMVASDQALDLVKDKLDVAIHAGELKDSGYRALPVGTMTEIWCASPNYLQRFGHPKYPQDLQLHKWVACPWQKTPLAIYQKAINSEPELINLPHFGRANTLTCAMEMAKQHMGLTLLPDIVAMPLIASNTLAHVLTSHRGPQWPVYFSHPYQAEKPLYITRFYQLVTHFFTKSQSA
jgi:DNA-binding transcriptional LysR family regulator